MPLPECLAGTPRTGAAPRAGGRTRAARALLRAFVAAAGLVLVAACRSHDPGLREAPDFTLPRLNGGDSLSLARDFAGRYVLMNFWASWCGPCRDEMPELIRFHRRYRDSDLAVLGVTVQDRPEDSRGFAREYGLEFPSVVGNDQLYEDYAIPTWIPVTLLVSPERRVLKEWLGPQTEAMLLQGIREAAPELAAAVERRVADDGAPAEPAS